MNTNLIKFFILVLFIIFPLNFFVCGCTKVPEGLTPVNNFDVQKYLGLWYEIARLDHKFERDLTNVTADYALKDDGSIEVTNKGYNHNTEKWSKVKGVAKMLGESKTGSLKVSFFCPFYAGYHIIELDENYRYAMVTGSSRSYLWILARENSLKEKTLNRLIAKAQSLGFDTEKLILVDHSLIEK